MLLLIKNSNEVKRQTSVSTSFEVTRLEMNKFRLQYTTGKKVKGKLQYPSSYKNKRENWECLLNECF